MFDDNRVAVSDATSLGKIPLLTKEFIRENEDGLVSRHIDSENFIRFNTGGSTDVPLEFPVSRLCGYIDRVHQRFHFQIMGYNDGDRVFAVDGTPVAASRRKRKRFWTRVDNDELPYGSTRYSALYIEKDNLEHYVGHLLRSKPAFLRGYPSCISEIAEYVLSNSIRARGFLKAVQLTAESVWDWQIDLIREAFGTKVYLQYGHSEMSVFAFTQDDTYEYQCSPFYGITEVVDNQGRHVPEGAVGEVVVTGFHNTAMPFIRYRTGDMAVYGGNARGITRLMRIEGRQQDVVYRTNGGPVPITGVVFGQHYQAFRNIRRWQIRQSRLGEIDVYIVKGQRFSGDDEAEVVRKLECVGGIKARVHYTDCIERTRRGKTRFVVVDLENAPSR